MTITLICKPINDGDQCLIPRLITTKFELLFEVFTILIIPVYLNTHCIKTNKTLMLNSKMKTLLKIKR